MSSLSSTEKRQRQRGSALLFALGLLVIFAALGTVYLREMNLELEKANYGLSKTRARAAAQAGINAATAELEQAIARGDVWNFVGRTRRYELPIYAQIRGASGYAIEVDERRAAVAEVIISDESGKININHADTQILARALGVDEGAARAIRAALPRGNSELDEKNNRRWLAELEDLVDRGLLSAEQLAKVDRTLVTTYSVADNTSPGRYLNLNTAPVRVLEIVFNLSPAEAEKLAVQRPFNDFAAIKAAIGKDPETFAFPLVKDDPDMLPEPFRLESRCFVLKSGAYQAERLLDRELKRVSAYAEAVVLFENDGAARILNWSSRRAPDELSG